MLYLNREQIQAIVERVGQPEASVLLNSFFNSYRHALDSVDVADLYDDTYLERLRSHPTILLVDGKFPINAYTQFAFRYLVDRVTPSQRVLDVGCGSGDFGLALAASTGVHVSGIDSSARAVELARSRTGQLACDFVVSDVNEWVGDTAYDFVVLNDVVEHLSDRELVPLLGRLRDLLANGGELLLHTPNGAAVCNGTDRLLRTKLFERYLRVRRGWRGQERDVEQLYYDQVHINIKSFRQLARVLRRVGLDAEVLYDERSRVRVLDVLSSNMLVIARKRRRHVPRKGAYWVPGHRSHPCGRVDAAKRTRR